jgi:hypothetical protein
VKEYFEISRFLPDGKPYDELMLVEGVRDMRRVQSSWLREQPLGAEVRVKRITKDEWDDAEPVE